MRYLFFCCHKDIALYSEQETKSSFSPLHLCECIIPKTIGKQVSTLNGIGPARINILQGLYVIDYQYDFIGICKAIASI